MNEIGIQQVQLAKNRTSAPDRSAGIAKDKGGDGMSPTVSKAEVRQTEQKQSLSAVEQQVQKKAEEAREAQVENAVAKLNDYVQNTERKLEFQLDEDSGQTVVRVYDKNSEELIRQIPNEEALELAQKLNQEEPLMLFSAQV
jgi:flagellar protein FlaG